jgi:aspartate aminotransferase-like enzyme
LKLATPKGHRLNSVVAIEVPEGADDARARHYMSAMFKVEIAGAFGLDVVRIGQMGEQCRAPNLFRVLHALGVALDKEGVKLDLSAGMAALEGCLAQYAEDVL